MPFEWKAVANLTLGVNYRNLTESRTSLPGEAQDAQDVVPREDGALMKTFGWLRRTPSALNGKPLACKGFTYRGKNTVAADPRSGNLGLANDGANFTRRVAEYPGFLLLTDATAYVWDPITETFVEVDPAANGFTIEPETKPSIEIAQDNCYVVGWATDNLRFDPTDRRWYKWGWEEVPGDPVLSPIAGDLIGGATYQYQVSFQDIYTGEESKAGDPVSITIPPGGGGVDVDLSGIVYTGDRHSNSVPGGDASDVALVVWRSGADDNSPRFLDVLEPGVTTLIDDGLVRETSLKPYRSVQEDEPRFSALKLFKGRFYALSKSLASNRVFFSHFDKAVFFERWRPLDFRDLEVPEGEVLTAIGGTDTTLLVYSQRGSFRGSVSVTPTAQSVGFQRMPWHVGAVGPRARFTVDGWEYFLSERGPYRWREGQTAPQNIGENLLPIFVEPTSGLCKLNPIGKEKSEVNFDWTSNTVVFTFALGDSEDVNTHMRYWIEAQRINGDYTYGWFRGSPDIQAMDLASSLVGTDAGGFPESPREKKQEIVFADSLGYVYEYRLGQKRGGLDPAEIAVTTVDVLVDNDTITVNDTPLLTTGDGLAGLRLEIESQPDANGETTTEVYTIASNAADEITINGTWTRDPVAGDAVRIAGIPAFWRSWFDHFGQPHQHKTMMDFSLGYQDRNNSNGSITVSIGSGEFPTSFSRQSTAVMNKARKKFTVSRTAVYFMYEFSNSIPDELFAITDFDREVEVVPARRKA